MDDNKNVKNFNCYDCDFVCYKQSNYDKHLLTLKHKKMTSGGQMDDALSQHHSYFCVCGNQYKHRQGLWKHKKLCVNNKPNENIFENEQFENNITHITPELIIEIIKQNQEFKEIIIEQNKQNVELQKQMFEVIKNVTHNTSSNSVNSNS